ncbi:MAG: hypothetical protein K9I74_10530 [Bacteroidales bacterium]|nr:hypothetical protein [Bacteroidales bacterium]
MEEHTVKILEIEELTHDVRRIVTEKPENYTFNPGQATEVAINRPGMVEERRPFTFTSLNDQDNLEFIIKVYHTEGVTDVIGELQVGDQLLIHDVWGAIQYKGPGYFLAGGAGITPFIAILRQLNKEGNLDGNKLFFSNKTHKDIILEDELKEILNGNAEFLLSREKSDKYHSGHIDREFLQKHVEDFNSYFYICGTSEMTNQLIDTLKDMGVKEEQLVYEQ